MLSSPRNPQLNRHGELIHLLSIDGLPRAVLHHILDTAGTFLSVNDREVKKVPLLCRIATLDELEYFRHGGILQYVIRQLVAA